MPDKVKKGGSWFILGTYVTSIALAVTYFLGGELLASHDNRLKMTHMQDTVDTTNQSMSEFIRYAHENRIEISKHSTKLEYCEKQIDECKRMHK